MGRVGGTGGWWVGTGGCGWVCGGQKVMVSGAPGGVDLECNVLPKD